MPNYNFKCQQCETKFTLQASMEEIGDDFQVECPECGSEDVLQTFDRVGIIGCSISGGGPG